MVDLFRVELSRRSFLKTLAIVGTSTALGIDLSPSQTQALTKVGERWTGAVIRNGFHEGPGYVTAPFWTPSSVPKFAAYEATWNGFNPASFGFWVDRFDLDRTVVTPVLGVGRGEFTREYQKFETSRFGIFPVEPDTEYWLGLAYLDAVMEIQWVWKVNVVPLWGEDG